VITRESQENIVVLSDIRREKSRALSPFGPLRAGLITWPSPEIVKEDHEARLMELLSSLESVVDDLNFKSFTVYDTLNTAIEGVRVALSLSTIETTGTDTI
jgi:hypothetical protein